MDAILHRGSRSEKSSGRLDSIRKVPECTIDERPQIPAIDVLIGSLAGSVMAAGKNFGDEVDVVLLELTENFA